MTVMSFTPDRVVVISDYSRTLGGASKLALLLAHRLRDRKIPVTLFCGDRDADDAGMLIGAGIEVMGVSGAALLQQRKAVAAVRGIWNTNARAALSSLIDQIDTPNTIYHVHGFLQTLSPSIFDALHRVRKRVVIHAHDYFLACPNGSFFDYQRHSECGLSPLSTSCILGNCDKRSSAQKLWRVVRQAVQNRKTNDFLRDARIILIHPDMRPYLERGERFITAPRVIRNPAEPFLEKPAAPATNSSFLFVGDIHVYKGVFELAKAARKAKVSVCFAGEGADRARLQNDYPEFQFAGWQDRQGLAALAREARAVIVPTLGPEPFGLTLVEAMTSGLPVIVSSSALMSAEIEDAGAGLCFRAGDSDHLAEILTRVARDDKLTQQLSNNAPEAAQRMATSPNEWCDKILCLYYDVLQDGEGTSSGQQPRLPEPDRIASDAPSPRRRENRDVGVKQPHSGAKVKI